MTAVSQALWAARAGTAERAVHTRHLRNLWWLPGTRLGVVAWPNTLAQRLFLRRWHYWWQAQLLDCLLDAQSRAPAAPRRAAVEQLVRGVRLRNLTGWTNAYYDDIAWLGLALHRAGHPAGVRVIAQRLRAGVTPSGGGGIWWRVGDDFKNVPANGPAAILLARLGGRDLECAVQIGHWLADSLVDPATGLLWDGLRVDSDGSVRAVEKTVYSYCTGVYLGLCVELAKATGDTEWLRRAAHSVSACVERLVDNTGVLRCHGEGDAGLFTGILARYLALAAVELPETELATRRLASALVLHSAEAAWSHRTIAVGGPLFGTDWSTPSSPPPEASRDLSVQLSGWMLCEAAALIERRQP